MPVVWPLRPRTRGVLQRMGRLDSLSPNVRLIGPVGYLDMVQLEKYAAVIATDSGGVQKEAFFCRVPCVNLRDETEWIELVEAGWNRLVSPLLSDAIASAINAVLETKGMKVYPYGNGRAAERIAETLVQDLCG
jgi:UDP-GlcNAc3NAcA epimerase